MSGKAGYVKYTLRTLFIFVGVERVFAYSLSGYVRASERPESCRWHNIAASDAAESDARCRG